MHPRQPEHSNRTSRLEARIASGTLAMVKRAAEIQGRSVSDFVVSAAQQAAHRTIEEAQIIRLSIADQKRFAKMLLKPPSLSPALKRAAKTHKRLISESR